MDEYSNIRSKAVVRSSKVILTRSPGTSYIPNSSSSHKSHSLSQDVNLVVFGRRISDETNAIDFYLTDPIM